MTKTIIISGCKDCPLCDMNDMSSGYSCKLPGSPDKTIKESDKYYPVTPEWCPIKKNDIIFKFES